MKVFVTGAQGQVGQCLTRLLDDKKLSYQAFSREQLDITDWQAVENAIMHYQPDIIINAAAYTSVDKAESEQDLAYRVNCDGAAHLARAAEKHKSLFLHISTDYVFSGLQEGTYSENDETSPLSVYGSSKLAGEKKVHELCSTAITLRTSWVFSEFGNNFVKTMIKLGQTRDTLNIVGDQFGGPTYAGDIAKTLLEIAEQYTENTNFEQFGIYHFSGFPYVSWSEFAEYIFNVAKQEDVIEKTPQITSIKTEEYPVAATRPKNSKLSMTKIKNKLGLCPSHWQEALKDIKHYRVNP
tara:strand:+ start:3130 stop:4017 length:888 start_codon:yes stop_codon:yes gene_type:complete